MIESSARAIPLEDFFRKPERCAPQLSPSGRFLAFLAPYERRLNVFLRELDSGDERRLTGSRARDIDGFVWADDRRIVYAQDTGGDENHRLYAVSYDGSNPIELTPFEDVKCGIIDQLEEVDGKVLIQMNRRNPELFDVYRLDVDTGDLELIAENPGIVQTWMTDNQGRLRMAGTTDGVSTGLLYRESEKDEWREVASHDFKSSLEPLSFTFDDKRIYATSNVGRDRRAIVEFDPETGQEVELIFEHSEVDSQHLLTSKRRKCITGVAYETSQVEYVFFDDQRRAMQDFLDMRMPGRQNAVVSYSRDETRYIVHSGGDRVRGGYYLLHVPADGEMSLKHLFDSTPWINEDQMAEMKPISYRSRDGLLINGYLTLPLCDNPKNLPLVVNPHGGPWARDSWGFKPEVQFLASRGYAVLQMNFRGSTGYGRDFWEASFGQWGLAMQDDVSDGVKWAIAEGIADPARVAIYGGSYGGYCALSGLTRTPELYACGISYVGVSNLFTWIEAFPPYWKPFLEMVYEMVGHPEKDAKRWKETSPFFNADAIRVPLLVAQGANDPRVKKEESDQIVAALRERSVDVEYLVKDDEGHGFAQEENQFEFYRLMETFLASHLGAS